MKDFMISYCDGASNPHTKRSGIGAVWFSPERMNDTTDGKTLKRGSIPEHAISKEIFSGVANKYPTNNEAEYLSLIAVLKESVLKGVKTINIFMDSKLVVEQVNGKWKINYPHLQKLKNEVDTYKSKIKITLKHVRREYNTHADKESKDCFKKKCTFFDSWKNT